MVFTARGLDAGRDIARRELPHLSNRSLPNRFRSSLNCLIQKAPLIGPVQTRTSSQSQEDRS